MLRLVMDTNTLVSAFFWKGNESQLLELIEKGKALLFLSPPILREVEEVLRRQKFFKILMMTQQTPEQIMQKITSLSHLVFGREQQIRICRDPKDDKFLECALLAEADYLVSGDNDLLALTHYQNIKVVRTSEILQIIHEV